MTHDFLLRHAFDAVLFDMDGVVIDSEPVSARAMQTAALRFGFEVPDEAMPSYKGLPGEVVYSSVAREHGAGRVEGPALRAVRDAIYEDWLPDIPLMPGVRDLLARLRGAGKRTAVVTSSRRRHADVVLATHGLGAYFDIAIGSEDVERPKPAPDPFLQAAKMLRVSVRRCVSVEDSVNGVQSASLAGTFVIGFGSDFAPAALTEAGADSLCADHQTVINVLGL